MTERVLEAGLGEPGVVAGHECALLQFYAEVARLRIGDHFAWIAAFPEESSDEFVQTELLLRIPEVDRTPVLGFRALLTEGGDRRVQLHSL